MKNVITMFTTLTPLQQHIWTVAYHLIRHHNLIHHEGLIFQT
jgi:hypothetical protein